MYIIHSSSVNRISTGARQTLIVLNVSLPSRLVSYRGL